MEFLPGVQFLDKVVDVPVVVQRQGVVEVPQLQFIDKFFIMAVGTGFLAVVTPFFALVLPALEHSQL